jgi:pyrroline-5-carboxylate reductase
VTSSSISLTLVGAGKMGGALLAGWLDLGLDPSHLIAVDPAPSAEMTAFCAAKGVRLETSAQHATPRDALVIAVKPQAFDAAAPQAAAFVGPRTVVVSIMAGKTIADIARRFPAHTAIVRAMPNTPAAVRKGISGAAAGPGVDAAQRALADRLLSAVGRVEWLPDESLLDAVTAVSGSGPAYVFYLTECLAAAGVAAGLPADVSARLARATVEGAGELLARSPDLAPGDLRRNVTSPGGTTAAALEVLMRADGLEPLMREAVEAARKRGEDLSG